LITVLLRLHRIQDVLDRVCCFAERFCHLEHV
jgi:hypothetical protein